MQKMSKETLQSLGFSNEFEMAFFAQNGDNRAWMALWKHYKNLMMSSLISCKGFTRKELESEALDVFATCLRNFDAEKVRSEAAYSLFVDIWNKVRNRTDKLIRQRKREVHLYFEAVSSASSRGGHAGGYYGFAHKQLKGRTTNIETEPKDPLHHSMIGTNKEIYSTYNPEKLIVEGIREDDTVRVKKFYARLTQLQKDILIARRKGLTLSQVAKRYNCSLTTIKNHLRMAKIEAENIFQVCYT